MYVSQTEAGLPHKPRLGAGSESVVRLSRSGGIPGNLYFRTSISGDSGMWPGLYTPSAVHRFCQYGQPPMSAFSQPQVQPNVNQKYFLKSQIIPRRKTWICHVRSTAWNWLEGSDVQACPAVAACKCSSYASTPPSYVGTEHPPIRVSTEILVQKKDCQW